MMVEMITVMIMIVMTKMTPKTYSYNRGLLPRVWLMPERKHSFLGGPRTRHPLISCHIAVAYLNLMIHPFSLYELRNA